MAQIVVSGDTSGSVTLSAPAVAGASVLTLPVATDTLVGKATTDTLTNKTLTSPVISGTLVMGASVLTSGTAVASTSGTSIDFTGIPSWAKRITVMFNGVSTNGTSIPQVQLGYSGGVETTGYTSNGYSSNTNNSSSTTGFLLGGAGAATYTRVGIATICSMGSNLWAFSYSGGISVAGGAEAAGGTKTTTGTLYRIRITTVNGTDTFDAGSINIMYE
jgi:hypothetical protein